MSTLEQQIANLRLQIDALEKSAKTASLPDSISGMRRTVRWSAILVAAALIVSSVVHLVSNDHVQALEQRVEVLEKKLPP